MRRRGYFVYIPELGRITSSNDVYFDERSFTLLGGVMSNVKLRGGIRTQNITPPAPPPTTPALPGTAPPVVVDAFVPADTNAIELALINAAAQCPWAGQKGSGFGYHSGEDGWRQFSSPKSLVYATAEEAEAVFRELVK